MLFVFYYTYVSLIMVNTSFSLLHSLGVTVSSARGYATNIAGMSKKMHRLTAVRNTYS
jgi:hypothetical protein